MDARRPAGEGLRQDATPAGPPAPADAGAGGWSRGLLAAVPVMLGYGPTALAFGLAAREAGLTPAEAALVSAVVYAGASQFALVGLLAAGVPTWTAALSSTLLNLRHLVYGVALAPGLGHLGRLRRAAFAFGLTDEVFAVASLEIRRRRPGFPWLLGLAAGPYLTWVAGTWAGAAAGALLTRRLPQVAPVLGFALPALFAALLAILVRAERGEGRRGVLAAAAAGAGVALACHLAGRETWAVWLAAVAGVLAAGPWGRGRGGHAG